jgi:hypothetical protein
MKLISVFAFLFSFNVWAAPSQSYTFKEGSAQFKLNATIKSVSVKKATPGVLIEYSVFKNGKFLHPDSEEGGRLLGCAYGYKSLPEDMVLPLAVNNKQDGWILSVGAICGNTFSRKIHLITVHPKGEEYHVKEVQSKYSPNLRKSKKGIEIWTAYQEWGAGGTAGSFLVPRLYLAKEDDSDSVVVRENLDSDITTWQQFKDFPFAFPSYFVAGMNEMNPDLMNNAIEKAFKDENSEWYKDVGLPENRKAAKEVATHLTSIKTYLSRFIRP